jgi:hypothetical protein
VLFSGSCLLICLLACLLYSWCHKSDHSWVGICFCPLL